MRASRDSAATWAALARPDADQPDRFDPTSLDGLPGPAQRLLRRVLPTDAPLVRAVQVDMSGEIKLGGRWLPFTAEQILRAGVGFVWRPIVGGRLLRFVGSDHLGADGARMVFRFQGLVPVARAQGPDTARSAAGRLAAETVAWIPQALVPQSGATWSAVDEDRAEVTLTVRGDPVVVRVGVDPDGRLRAIGLSRWNDGADPPAEEPFGGPVTSELVTDDGVRVAGGGEVGWGWETPAFDDGAFFRYTVTGVRPVVSATA